MCMTFRNSGRGTSRALPPPPPAARSATTSVIESLYGWAACTRPCARTMRLAAISSCARVIFCVDWIVLILRRRSRSWPPAIGVRYSAAAAATSAAAVSAVAC